MMALADELGWAAVVVFLRVAAMFALLPGIGEQSLSVRVKLMAAAAATIIILPAAPMPEQPPGLGSFAAYLVSETVIGLLLGIGARLILMAMQTAAAMAAQATSLAQLSGGAFPDPLPAMGQVLSLAAVALFMLLDGHVAAIMLLIQSYELLPMGVPPSPTAVAEWGTARIAKSFGLALQLAAPFLIAATLYNLTLGAINRAMPQLMVAFIGAPVITLGALALLIVCAPVMLGVWHGELSQYLSDPLGVR